MKRIKIRLDHTADKDFSESGCVSELSWMTLLPFINEAFKVKPDEKIRGIVVTDNGIKAMFDKNKTI